MAWKEVSYKLTSSAPLLMHNGQLSDPLNKWTKLIAKITSKRKKTDADHEEIARLEFFGGLYLDEEGPILPAPVIDAMVINGAKKFSEGPKAKSGCFCTEHAKLEYEGPRTAKELWEDETFRNSSRVRVNRGSSVQRMRPMFPEWTAVITLQVEDTVVSPERIDEWLQTAGNVVGLCDWRPQHGRFTVEKLNGK